MTRLLFSEVTTFKWLGIFWLLKITLTFIIYIHWLKVMFNMFYIIQMTLQIVVGPQFPPNKKAFNRFRTTLLFPATWNSKQPISLWLFQLDDEPNHYIKNGVVSPFPSIKSGCLGYQGDTNSISSDQPCMYQEGIPMSGTPRWSHPPKGISQERLSYAVLLVCLTQTHRGSVKRNDHGMSMVNDHQ